MIRTHILAIILTGITIYSVNLCAQDTKVFSGDTGMYINELYAFMQRNINEESAQVLDEFVTSWDLDSIYSPEEQEDIIYSSQLMTGRNAKPYPHFMNYLKCILLFKTTGQDPENYINWQNGLNMLLNDSKTSLLTTGRYLIFTKQFIDSSSLHRSVSVDWKTTNPEFVIKLDTTIRFIINNTNLVCYSKRDSIHIFETSGSFNPVTTTWSGTGGIVNWERAGLSRDNVFATLDTYSINMSRSEYNADDVIFTNNLYFNSPLTGHLTDKVKYIRSPEVADYPQFDSYQQDFQITNLYENIDYEGGLSMQGAKLIGTGNHFQPAKIFIYRNDTLVITGRSEYFAFRADRINAPLTNVTIALKNDSIYHPGIALSYLTKNKELTLFQTDNFTTKSPYFNSYHNIDMTFEQLVWKMDEPLMRFTALMGRTTGSANFESVSFFNNQQYLSLQFLDEVHPLISIRSFARHMGTEEFLAEDFADYLRKPLAQVKQLLMRMASLGFLFYDTETDMAAIRQRLHDYIAASVAKIDYDVISFPSHTNSPVENAVFDLRNYDLTINGIPSIFVSDSQNVVIIPENDRIIMKKNRHFQFDGIVQAGLFTFNGKNFFFNYDTFKISLNKIDSLHIRYLTGMYDGYGFPIIEDARNLIQDIKGELYIDEPDNKSGRNSYPEYPVFKSVESGFVYYDSKNIQEGAYTRDRFFFEVDTFQMDSLDNFDRRSMQFKGQLTSAGIFPVIPEILRLQPDKSLGFQHMTPDSGLSLYGGRGVYYNEITLNNSGLSGSGEFNYLTSRSLADHITFLPDSMKAFAREFTIAEQTSGTQFPFVQSINNNIKWLPYEDELYAYRTDSLFNMFNNSSLLAGDLKLQPGGLTGNGRMFLEGAELISAHFDFRSQEILADTADFNLKSLHNEGLTVLTQNIDAHIDFSEQKGLFTSNEDFTLVSFPENKYVSYLDFFEWDMANKELAMGSHSTSPPAFETSDEGLTGPRYICIDPEQDSLSFISSLAYYDYDSNLIKATNVKYLDIADARIYPYDEKLTVQSNSWLKPLYQAKVTANRDLKYFDLYDATITVTGRYKYHGTAYYNYIDELEQEQVLYFNELGVDDNAETTGSGIIEETDDFTLSPNYRYQGKFSMQAANKFLHFDGSTLIEQNCEQIPIRWFYFNSEIDPQNIFIPVGENLYDIDRNKVYNGLFMYYDSVHVYPAFFSAHKYHSDNPVSTANGFLYFDKELQKYVIASKDKIMDRSGTGNMLTLDREGCNLEGEGRVDLGENLGQVKLTAVGKSEHSSIKNQTVLDVILGVDFYIADDIIDIMAVETDSMPTLPATDLNSEVYTKGIVELLGKSGYDEMRSELSLFGSLKEMPAAIKHTIFFNELKLEWNDESNSWMSVGKIGIASINNTQINKRVNGLIEIQIKRSGDIMDIYLEMDRRTWYYFGYTRGVMQIHSSNSEFIDEMMKLKTRDRRLKVSGTGSYTYMVSTETKKNSFVRKYRDRQEGDE